MTRVGYAPSTQFYLEDQKRPETRWKTPLPFPVQVVARVEVIDEISRGKLTTEYRYHHGYWDGAEREFRGFGMVEQLIPRRSRTTTAGIARRGDALSRVEDQQTFPRRRSRRPGSTRGRSATSSGSGRRRTSTPSSGRATRSVLPDPRVCDCMILNSLPRRVKRDALRALRGRVLRTELTPWTARSAKSRPYTVTEHLYGVCEVVEENGQHSWRASPTGRFHSRRLAADLLPPRRWRSGRPSGSAAMIR